VDLNLKTKDIVYIKMKILYGIKNNKIDVTKICYDKLMKENIIKIPSNDNVRAKFFTDPLFGVVKYIFIIKENDDSIVEYNHLTDIYIDTKTNEIYTKEIPEYIALVYNNSVSSTKLPVMNSNETSTERGISNLQWHKEKLKNIHSQLKIGYGSFEEEYPEQLMAVRYLTGYEKVLEIGSNIGRNSLIINHILSQKNNNNFVTLESDNDIANILKYNRDLNKYNFHIETAALSKRRLIQKGWNTVCSDVLLDGYKNVNTITLEELNKKYNIEFDTLVLDCEGAFYYILMDIPEILNNIRLIIMENDYKDITHKNYIDDILLKNNFYVDYVECGGSTLAYNKFPHLYDRFFEVWKKR
jgi:FkbM family methyltransferase